MTFESEDALRRAKATKRAMRRRVRRDRRASDAHIGTKIGTGGVNRAAREHHRRKCAVRAAIDLEINLLREQFAVLAYGSLMSRAGGMALGRRHHIFRAVVNDLDRFACLPGE